MNIPSSSGDSPLEISQIALIDQLKLPSLEKHHLRLLMHCLESFKLMQTQVKTNNLPSKKQQLDWCLANPRLANDKEFISILMNQFEVAALYLEKLALTLEISPLELTLDDLILDALSSG